MNDWFWLRARRYTTLVLKNKNVCSTIYIKHEAMDLGVQVHQNYRFGTVDGFSSKPAAYLSFATFCSMKSDWR